MEKKAWNELITGPRRAGLDLHPDGVHGHVHRAVPEAEQQGADHRDGYVGASASVTIATTSTGSATSVMRRAPTASESRPPTCIEVMPATPARNSIRAICPSLIASLSRSEGRLPP